MAAAFRQVEVERILKVAQKVGGLVEVDLRTMKIVILPGVLDPRTISLKDAQELITRSQMAPDGEENWDDY